MGPKRKRTPATEAFVADIADDGNNLAGSDDDRPKKADKKIRAKDGQLGFYNKQHFDSRTNFTLEVKADIYSKQYQLKGQQIFVIVERGWGEGYGLVRSYYLQIA